MAESRQHGTMGSKTPMEEPMSEHIIDTHTHFFDPARSIGVPWPSSDDAVLYKPTFPERFLSLATPHGVTGTVVVEASPWLEDNQWILDLAESNPVILGFVGNLDVFGPDFVDNLERFSAHTLFRGIRLGGHALNPEIRGQLLASLKELASRQLALDLLVQPEALLSVAHLADLVPDLHIMIDHVAHVSIDGRTPDDLWAQGIAACGHRDNIYCKISGLVEASGTTPAPSDPSFYQPTLDLLAESFGTGRLAYGSNWPVCEKNGNYETVFSVPREYFVALGEDAADAVFRKNALGCYRCVESRAKS